MTRVYRESSQPVRVTAAVFGSIDAVANVERQRMFGPDPEPIEAQIARYQASEEARQVVLDAYKLAVEIREEAKRSGFESGWKEGFAAGRHDAEERVRAADEQFRSEYCSEMGSLLAGIQTQTAALWNDAEAQMIGLAVEVARKVVKQETAINPEIVVEVVKNALRHHVASGEGDLVRIRVNAADLENLRAAREDILTVIDGARNVEIIEDRRVSQGGAVVESGSGTIDASVETQFRMIEDAMHEVRESSLAERLSGAPAMIEGEEAA